MFTCWLLSTMQERAKHEMSDKTNRISKKVLRHGCRNIFIAKRKRGRPWMNRAELQCQTLQCVIMRCIKPDGSVGVSKSMPCYRRDREVFDESHQLHAPNRIRLQKNTTPSPV